MDNANDRNVKEKDLKNPSQSQQTKSGDAGSWQKKDSASETRQRTFTEPDNPPSRDISKQQTGGPDKPTA